MSRARLVSLAAAAPLAVAVAVALAEPAPITPQGVGSVHIGDNYLHLRKAGKIGKVVMGCELAGPNARSAKLLPPAKGFADLSFHSPRKITNITITGGATAKGVGIGDTLSDIKAAYPKAYVDHTTEETFAFTLVVVRGKKNGNSRIAFAVDTGTKKITSIGIPYLAACE
jgi:hypothetical protein